MTLTLRAVSLNDHPLTQPITAHFDVEGGSVGRGDHNTLALPDPERHISRQHAEISASGTGYAIRNVGSSNPIIVRGQALARGESALLAHRDQVRIGGYLLEVIHEARPDDEACTVVRGRAAVDASTPGVQRRAASLQGAGTGARAMAGTAVAGMGDLSAPLSRNNPFADLLGDGPPPSSAPRQPGRVAAAVASPVASPLVPALVPSLVPPLAPSIGPAIVPAIAPQVAARVDAFANPLPPAAGVAAASAAWGTPAQPPARVLLPDDFDPFAALAPAPPPAASAAPAPATARAGAFDDLIPNAEPASIDHLFGLQPGQRDPLADFMADVAGPTRGEPQSALPSTDPMAMFDDMAAAHVVSPNGHGFTDHVPELHGAFTPPAVRPPPVDPTPAAAPPAAGRPEAAAAPRAPRPVAPPLPATPAEAWQGNPHELWAAFCEGAGVAVHPQQGINPELMRVVGSLLQAAVAGTLQLMTVRATAKHELRAEVTMIQARNNNPLKFSPDARSALEQLLQPPMRGFLAGPAAMTDAMHDLVGHTIGTMAGTRAALEGVLDRFTPQQLEAKLSVNSVLDSVLPMNRKAKLWTLYLQQFEAIRNEAQDDFHSLFGRAFLAAYEQQLERLKRDETGKA